MTFSHYRFQSTWHTPFEPCRVYKVLRAVELYPEWWPEIREVRELDEDSFVYRVRSFLPYWLEFSSQRTLEDTRKYVLEAKLSGDLDGFSRWTITQEGNGSQVVFEEEVDTRKRSLNLLAPVARPAFKRNHTVMMKHGEEGLLRFLAHVGVD